jgi:membrane dipeptidase
MGNLQAQESKAEELAKKILIIDGHMDLPYRLLNQGYEPEGNGADLPVQTDKGDFDYIRAKKGGLDAAFMAVYIPPSYQEKGGAKAFADSTIDMMESLISVHSDKFAAARTPSDVKENFIKGLISLPLAMENGAGIENDLSNLTHFHSRGICYITLTHSKDNQICDSSYDTERTWNGLSPFGRDVVREMNKLGMMIDVSHITDSAFYQVLALSQAPVLATHSSARHYTPGFERNMDDEMIRQLAGKRGIIMINFGSVFLDGDIMKEWQERSQKRREVLAEAGVSMDDPEARPVLEKFNKENPLRFSTVEKVVDHIEHVVSLAGIDAVGLGSDFDGVGDSLPVGLKDVSYFPNLIRVLLERGYSETDIEKICSGNLLRVWQNVLDYANQIE